MKIKEKIKKHHQDQKFARITRKVAKDWKEISRGYIVGYSDDFVVLQESDDFKLLGFNVLPVDHLLEIRYNHYDKYYDKIMGWEEEKDKIGLKTKVNLTDWKAVFKTFQKKKMSVIVECENPKINSFTIGQVKRITDKHVYILYFDAAGFLDEKPTKLKFENITKITFDDRYVDIFSKYTRKRKKRKKKK
ncbi:hypothetical protein BKI52_16955 [marine bacterium AO1-C]|nr:hypothetical protein BKI52_16955 [marine bacterium AO1-C]